MSRTILLLACSGVIVFGALVEIRACPYCSSSQPTLDERFRLANLVVVVRRITPGEPDETTEEDAEKSKPQWHKLEVEVIEVLKGEDQVQLGTIVRTQTLDKSSQTWVLFGRRDNEIVWEWMDVTERSLQYLKTVTALPPRGVERLRFIKNHLEDVEPLLIRDAYEEFARTDYATIQALGPELDPDRLMGWIDDAAIASNHRRLYLTLLSVCGKAEHARQLEAKIRMGTEQDQLSLDALVSAYLTLHGEEGLAVVEDQFFKNPGQGARAAYSVLLALRFHLNTAQVIDRDRLLATFRRGLSFDELVPLVLADLARLEDWSAIDQAVEVFRRSTSPLPVRVAILRYLQSCPLASASERAAELATLDADAARRSAIPINFVEPSDATAEKANDVDVSVLSRTGGETGARAVAANVAPESGPLEPSRGWQGTRVVMFGAGIILIAVAILRIWTAYRTSGRIAGTRT
jgi:hypothetical protein